MRSRRGLPEGRSASSPCAGAGEQGRFFFSYAELARTSGLDEWHEAVHQRPRFG
jgi:hypothetical protein